MLRVISSTEIGKNHQLASYNDCIPIGDGKESRMENIVRNIRIGSDEQVEDDEGGLVKLDLLDKEIIVRLKNLRLGRPTIKEANGRNTTQLQWNAGSGS